MRIIKNWKLIKDNLQYDLDKVQLDSYKGKPELEAMIREEIVFLESLLDCVVAENPEEKTLIKSIKELCCKLKGIVF